MSTAGAGSDNIENRIKAIIAEHLGSDPGEVTPEAKISGDLGADSLDAVEIIMALEQEFGCEIPDEEIENVVSVQDAIDTVRKRAA